MQRFETLSVTLLRDLAQRSRGVGLTARRGPTAAHLWQKSEELKERKGAGLREKIDRSLSNPRPPLDEDHAFACLEERFVVL
ncbi:MAG: hypothetical protein ACREJ0_30045 [Geminicoccaceae bacterium]